ncbi:MAG TPA: hypothetical protein VGP94_15190, partial [Tepidisphaeraceae bacterium]|nr:hypothetical protein [Tepidisphaeraceae bacterium]
MPRIAGCNDRQSSFLRAFHDHPAGPPPQHWPSPAILRRWLRKPRFRAALKSIHSTLRLQESFLLTAASNTALRTLDPISSSPNLVRNTLTLLRLSHLRHRFETTSTPPAAAPAKTLPPKPKAEPEKPKFVRP